METRDVGIGPSCIFRHSALYRLYFQVFHFLELLVGAVLVAIWQSLRLRRLLLAVGDVGRHAVDLQNGRVGLGVDVLGACHLAVVLDRVLFDNWHFNHLALRLLDMSLGFTITTVEIDTLFFGLQRLFKLHQSRRVHNYDFVPFGINFVAVQPSLVLETVLDPVRNMLHCLLQLLRVPIDLLKLLNTVLSQLVQLLHQLYIVSENLRLEAFTLQYLL